MDLLLLPADPTKGLRQLQGDFNEKMTSKLQHG